MQMIDSDSEHKWFTFISRCEATTLKYWTNINRKEEDRIRAEIQKWPKIENVYVMR